MDHQLVVVLLLLPWILPQAETTGQCPPLTYFYYTFDWVFVNHSVVTYKVPNEDWCYALCIRDKRCRSLNYQIKTDMSNIGNLCDINYSTKNRHPGSMRKRPGWVNYEIKDADFLPTLEPVTITTSLSPVWVEEHQDITLICNATGQPAPTITWSKVGGELKINSKINGGRLTLSSVKRYKDDGIYRCKAKNELNDAEDKAKITVVPVLQLIAVPPKIVTTSRGSRMQIDCQGTSFSNATWQHNGKQLPSRHLQYSNGTLVFLNATEPNSGYYTCTVKSPFRSITATTHVRIYHTSCSHVKAAHPYAFSGNYMIYPDTGDGADAFTVYCDMTEKNGIGVTVISHNRENREHVTGCEPAGCFIRNVSYSGVTMAQLERIIRVNSYCEQFVMFECTSLVEFIAEKSAWWMSRHGTAMKYWGGATPGSRKCACGMSNTCVGGGRCNCKNWGPSEWRNDSGLLIDKSSLPVTELRFGDVGHSWEEGYYTLGKFKCYGSITIRGTNLTNHGNDNPLVLSGLSLEHKRIGNYSIAPMVGRYVNIRLIGRGMVLTLCEVQVFVCPAT